MRRRKPWASLLTLDVIERHTDRHGERQPVYVPVLLSHRNKLDREDSPLAALHGIVLAGALGRPVPVPFVKIVHGPGFSVSKIKLVGPKAKRPVWSREGLGRFWIS